MMKQFLFVVLLMGMVCGVAVGQEFPKAEIFGGYSILRLGVSDSDLDNIVPSVSASTSKFMMKGFNASAAFNATPSIGIVADFRYNQANVVEFTADADGSTVSGKIKLRDISVMAGPRFTSRKSERVTPFVHALVGLDHWRLSGEGTVDGEVIDPGGNETSKGLGVALGGGVDVNVAKSLAIRLFQVDYFLTRHENESWNNLNLAFGVVFHVGK